jgi:hypothetical protein
MVSLWQFQIREYIAHRDLDGDLDRIEPVRTTESSGMTRRKRPDTRSMSKATSMENAVSSIFVLGGTTRSLCQEKSLGRSVDLATLTLEELGGIEYRALRVLLKVTIGKCSLMVAVVYTNTSRILLWSPPV